MGELKIFLLPYFSRLHTGSVCGGEPWADSYQGQKPGKRVRPSG